MILFSLAPLSGTTAHDIYISRCHIVNNVVCKYQNVWHDFMLATRLVETSNKLMKANQLDVELK